MKHQRKAPHRLFAETQMGIVTRYGDWFHTTRNQISTFVPGLLDEVELEDLVKSAQAWVKSADSLSMILILGLLLLINPLWAVLATLVFHGFWYFNKSSFVMVSLNKLLQVLYKDGTQLLVSLVVLSYLGLMGRYLAAGIGLLFFFVLKLGLLRKLWDIIYRKWQDLPITLNDRVMKMVIVRFAMHLNMAPEQIEQMEEQIVNMAGNHRNRK
ncbi:MAG: hypothetical protein R3281_13080 [Balneolaceae bacterium]|nr:hypothetical protein [Balneolaceae bacterium]